MSDVLAHLKEVESSITGLPGWRVEYTTLLALFSFFKGVMYRDLEENTDKATAHPLVRAHGRQSPQFVSCLLTLAEAARMNQDVGPSQRFLRRAGRLLEGNHSPDYAECLFHEKTLTSVEANTRADGEDLLREAASVAIRAETTPFPLEQANEALTRLKAGEIDGTGVLVIDPVEPGPDENPSSAV